MIDENLETPFIQEFEESIYDIKVNSLNGEKDILSKYKGKVTMIVNVTGECANSAQYPLIQDLYLDYKDRGFEVLAIPSTDFCEFAYGEFADSGASPENMKKHMENHYGTFLPYSEMMTIKEDLENGLQPHYLYRVLQSVNQERLNKNIIDLPVQGNFEKFIINKTGKKMLRFCNSDLLNLAFDAGNRKTNSDVALARIKEAIEFFLAE
jgi:glutathione peroxidase